jgi:hypothetical protein
LWVRIFGAIDIAVAGSRLTVFGLTASGIVIGGGQFLSRLVRRVGSNVDPRGRVGVSRA